MNNFKSNVRQDPAFFLELISGLDKFTFESKKNAIINSVVIKSEQDLQRWLDGSSLEIYTSYSPSALPPDGKSQVEEVVRTFRQLYPIYFFAIADDPWSEV